MSDWYEWEMKARREEDEELREEFAQAYPGRSKYNAFLAVGDF